MTTKTVISNGTRKKHRGSTKKEPAVNPSAAATQVEAYVHGHYTGDYTRPIRLPVADTTGEHGEGKLTIPSKGYVDSLVPKKAAFIKQLDLTANNAAIVETVNSLTSALIEAGLMESK